MTEVVTPDKGSLRRMGVLTGLAIGLHNLPKGLATFVATLSSPSFGGALAIAIALHNIPEGVCVSMPVYYATGSRVKGFLWAFLSGISEPLGVCCTCIIQVYHYRFAFRVHITVCTWQRRRSHLYEVLALCYIYCVTVWYMM